MALLAAVAILGGCSSPQRVEVQNEGPGEVTVTFRYAEDRKAKEDSVVVPQGGAEIESIWFGAPPESVEIEAKWASAVRRQTFRRAGLPKELQSESSMGSTHGLSVSPDGFRWGSAAGWTRTVIPLWPFAIFSILFGVAWWAKYRKTARKDEVSLS